MSKTDRGTLGTPGFATSPQFPKWRDLIFSIEPEDVGVSEDQPDRVYGVLMDVGLVHQDGSLAKAYFVISVSAFASGESSLNTSVGGGVIGLGNEEYVAGLARSVVSYAQALVEETQPAQNQDLPGSGRVSFYFLTPSGIRFYGCSLQEAYAAGHPFNRLFSLFSQIKRRADELRDQAA